MATWNRHPKGYVLVRTFKDGKQTRLPRAETDHLDGLSDEVIHAWVEALEPRTVEKSPGTACFPQWLISFVFVEQTHRPYHSTRAT